MVAVTVGPGAERRYIAPGVGLAHADAPLGGAGDDVGKEPVSLLVGAELQERRADLTVSEPCGGDGGALGDERLEHREALDRRSSATAHSVESTCQPPVRGRIWGSRRRPHGATNPR